MTLNNGKLIGLQRAEFNKAAKLQLWILRVQVFIAIVAGAAVFVEDSVVAYSATIAAVTLALVWAWLGWSYRESRGQAERSRRATLLMDGLGVQVSSGELRDLEASFTISPEEGAKHEDPNYYATQAPPGDARLAEMIEETTFWSADLMHYSARRTWILFIVFLGLGLAFLFAAVPWSGNEEIKGGVRVFCALLTLLVSTDVLGAAFSYGNAAKALKSMLPRLEAVRALGYPRADLLLLLADYNSAVEGAPMYPPGIYDKRRDRLNKLWNNRQPHLPN